MTPTLIAGDWELTLLDGGRLALDGGAMFGSVPRVVWEKRIAPDSVHRIPLVMRLLFLQNRSAGLRVLVDTGIGNKFDDRFASMFAVENPHVSEEATPLEGALRGIGVNPTDLTHVLLTHLHFDHGGGVSCVRDGDLQLTFPHATHIVQRQNLQTAQEPNPRERASYLRENVEPLTDGPLELLDGTEDVLPGIQVQPVHGHTAGMQVVRIEGGGRVLYYVADLAPTQHHVHLPFTMGYDLSALTVMAEKEALWSRAIEEEAELIFEHDPVFAHGRLVLVDGKYGVEAP